MLKIVQIVFYIILLLFVVDALEVFQTKIKLLKVVVYYGVLVLPILLLIGEFIVNRNIGQSILRKAIPILTIIGLIYLGPIKILFHVQPWKTQTVELINESNRNRRIEHQTKDIGALGFAKRKVEVFYVTKYFYLVISNN